MLLTAIQTAQGINADGVMNQSTRTFNAEVVNKKTGEIAHILEHETGGPFSKAEATEYAGFILYLQSQEPEFIKSLTSKKPCAYQVGLINGLRLAFETYRALKFATKELNQAKAELDIIADENERLRQTLYTLEAQRKRG